MEVLHVPHNYITRLFSKVLGSGVVIETQADFVRRIHWSEICHLNKIRECLPGKISKAKTGSKSYDIW